MNILLILFVITVVLCAVILVSRVFLRLRREQDKLRESEQRLQFAVDGSGFGLWDWNILTNEVSCSEKWNTMFGLDQNENLNNLEDWNKRIHPDDLESVFAETEKCINGQVSIYKKEFRVQCKDGSYKWIISRGKIISRTDDGKPERMLGTHADITEQKQAEESSIFYKLQLETILNNMDALIYISDIQTYEILFVNNHMKRAFREDLIGNICWKSLHDDMDGPCAFCTNDKLTDVNGNSTDPYIWEIYNQKLNRWYEIHDQAIPWKDGRLVRLEMAIDITDKKKSEEALIESESRFRSIFADISNIAVQGYDKDRKVTYWNKASEKLYGYKEQDALSSKLEELIIYPEMRGEVKSAINNWFINDVKISNEELILKDKDNAPVNVFSSHIMIKDLNGNKELFCIDIDIADRKKAEEEIKNQLLEKEIILKEAHHRIKNNLASIGSLLSLQAGALSNPEAITALKDAIGRVKSMQILYEKLLLTDNYNVTSIKRYLSNLIDEIISLFPDVIDISVEKQIDDFTLDPKRLVSFGIIVNELLTNVIKYAFEGRNAGLIQISLKESEGKVTLIIQDDGNGLPDGFDFEKQTGFGLMLVKMLSQQLKGDFHVENRNGTRSILEFSI